MRPCSTIIALCALLFCAGFIHAEEHSVPFLASYSSTTVRGYIKRGTHWQRHVCRPVLPVRAWPFMERFEDSLRIIGRSIDCRHGRVFVPNSGRIFPTINSSSRFSSGGAIQAISYETYSVLMEANRLYSQPGGRRVPMYPPLPPNPLPPVPQDHWGGVIVTSPNYEFPFTWP